MNRSRLTSAQAILIALLSAGVLLIVIEVALGATSNPPRIADPCAERAPFPGSGIDAAIQRIVLDGLDGAACKLHTSREELVLSLAPGTTEHPRKWTKQTIETAIRAGLLRAVDNAEQRGDIPSFLAPAVRRLVQEAPIDKLVNGGFSLSDLIG